MSEPMEDEKKVFNTTNIGISAPQDELQKHINATSLTITNDAW